jgi:hypothetical protein
MSDDGRKTLVMRRRAGERVELSLNGTTVDIVVHSTKKENVVLVIKAGAAVKVEVKVKK